MKKELPVHNDGHRQCEVEEDTKHLKMQCLHVTYWKTLPSMAVKD